MTVYFIALYYPFESTFEPLKAAIGRWVKLRARSVKSKTFADEVWFSLQLDLFPSNLMCSVCVCWVQDTFKERMVSVI